MVRIIEIKDTPARVKLRYGCLVIDDHQVEHLSIPTSEVGVLILSNPALSCSSAILSEIAEQGGVIITCDQKMLPNGILLPLRGNHVQTQRLRLQIAASIPLKKRLWKSIIQRKILNQASVLNRLYCNDFGLNNLSGMVLSGDTTNVEARAAKKYWGLLFDTKSFRRGDENAAPNPLLNYGYAVLRAIVSRAICGSGLHPSIGIHHRNKYNAFCLADDLMEPFRPTVDYIVAKMLRENPSTEITDTEVRGQIIAAVSGPWIYRGESRSIFDASGRLASSLVTAFESKRVEIELPIMDR